MELSELAQLDSGPAPSGVSQVDAVEPIEVAVDSGAARGAEPAGAGSDDAGSGGAATEGAEPGGVGTGGAEPGGAGSGGAETWGAEPGGAATGGTEPGGAERRAGGTTATTGYGGTCPSGARAAGPGGTAEGAGVGPTGGLAGASGGTGAAGSAGPGAAGATGVGATGGVGAGDSADAGPSEGAGAGAAGAGGATGAGALAESPGAVPAGSGGAPRPRPYFVPLLEQVLGLPPSPGPAPPFEGPQPVQSQSLLQPVSPLPAPSPYTGPTGGLAERRAHASRPASPARPACTSRRTSRPRSPAVPGTHQMALRPSTTPLRVPLPSPPASSLLAFPDPESDSLRAASPTVALFLVTVVTDPSLASTAASALVAELVDFAASCRLHYTASLVAESASVCPPSVGGECALSTDVLEDRQEEFQCFAAALPHLVSTLLAPEGDTDAPDIPTPRSYADAIEGPYSSQWQAAMDAEMASWKSTGTYVDEVPPPGANIGVDYFQTFSPTPKMTTLRVLLHVAAQRDYELHSLDFSTAFLQGSLHEEIWLRRPPGFTGSFPPGTQWSLRRPVYGLRQAPREWHDTLRTTLAALGFAPSTADPLCGDFVIHPEFVFALLDWSCDLLFSPTLPMGVFRLVLNSFASSFILVSSHGFLPISSFLHSTSLPSVRIALPFPMPLPPASCAACCLPFSLRCPASARPACCANMASLRILAFDHEVTYSRRCCPLSHLQPSAVDRMRSLRTAQALHDAIVARYSSPATAALGRLLLPYLFPELSAFVTVEDLVSHLRTSDARYRAPLSAEFLAKNPPLMYITLYFIVTRLLDSLRAVLLVALHARPSLRGAPPPPLLPPMPLLLLLTSLVLWMSGPLLLVRGAAAARARVAGVVAGAARVVVGAAVEVVGAGEVVAAVGVVAGVGALVAAVEAAVGVAVVAAVGVVAVGLELRVEVLEKARGSSSFVCGLFSVGRLGSASAGSDFYLCVLPYPGIEAAALGASESIIPSTAPAEALHTFTLDSRASRCFFRDSTTLTPLSAPVPVTLADPSGALVLARSSTVLLCPVVPSGSL
ncbi:unnamed protein product [Closterium sp. NIES-54]